MTKLYLPRDFLNNWHCHYKNTKNGCTLKFKPYKIKNICYYYKKQQILQVHGLTINKNELN